MTAGGTGPMAAQAEMPAGEEQTRIGELLERIARPRLCGSAGAAEVDGAIRGELERLGYEVRELPFTFSALPGRWAVPAAGVLLALAGIISAACAAAHNGAAALAVLAVAVALLIVAAANAGDAIRRLPWQRLEGVNWLATRPGARPSYLVSAHRDSKSQAVPLLARAAAIVGALVSLAALFLLDLVALIGPERWHLALPAVLVALVAAAAGTTLALCIVRNDSPGALDNASGLVALLALAARERGNPDVGFLLTDAEELGLAGASAVCGRLPQTVSLINLDGLDDGGDFQVVDRHGFPPRGLAPHLVAALLGAAHRLELPARRRTLPLGVLADHVPFVESGRAAVTLMRGERKSLERVHLPADNLSRLSGAGAADAAALVSTALELLRTRVMS